MSNGNDWQGGGNDWTQPSNGPQQSGGQGGGQFGPGGQGGGGGHGGGGHGGGGGFQPPGGGSPTDMITEGWGGGPEVTVDEVVARLKLVASRAKGSILKAWLMVGAVMLVFNLIDASISVVNHYIDSVAISGTLGAISMMLGVVAALVSIAAGAFQIAMFKPLHRAIFEGEHAVGGPMDVINEAKGPFVFVLILTVILTLVTGLGIACCIVPGLFFAFIACQAPYLAATRGLSPIKAIKRSLEINKTYWVAILVAIAALFIIGGLAGCFVSAGTFVIGLASSFLYPFSLVFIVGLAWLFGQVGMFGIFLVHAALFSTLETKETGKMAAS